MIKRFRQRLAIPYVLASTRETNALLSKQFYETHKLNADRIERRIGALTYAKPWPENVAPNDAFNLAIHEALIIIREEMR
jgi:hypothetical protein